ncbi:hypothetical protein OAQ37_05240 [Alphaproteobacteria bacterium]|nr:hypothetical protein [Alphaproteobacteria bacterium]
MKVVAQSLGQPVRFFLLGLFCGGFADLLIITQYWLSYLNFLSSTILLTAFINLAKQPRLSDNQFTKAANIMARAAITRRCHDPIWHDDRIAMTIWQIYGYNRMTKPLIIILVSIYRLLLR